MPLPTFESARRPRVLTASAARLGDADSEYAQRKAMTWQRRALTYIDLIPELSYASRFYARMLKQVTIFPGTIDDQQKITPIESGQPVEILNRIQDPGGGRSSIQGNYGTLMFTTGEGLLFGRNLRTENERWSFVWTEEVETETDGQGNVVKYVHKPNGNDGTKEYGPEEAVAYRFWVPHPRNSGEPNSPMRSSLEIAEELIVLTKSVASTAVTRMTRGLLKVPTEISEGSSEPGSDEDPEANPFLAQLVAHLTAQVEQAGSAAAAAPWLVEGAAEYLDQLQWVSTHDPQTDYMERDLRKEAVERLARGFDMPVEVLLGLSGANHWAARQILDDMWRSHGAPITEQWCDDLNEAYLRPALREANFNGWENVVIGYDESQVVVKPDRAEDAFKAYELGVISDDALLEAINMVGAEKPSPEELQRRAAWKNGGRRAEPGRDPAEGPPPPGPEGDSGRRTRVVSSAGAERELGAAEMALIRCRELAGIRIRQKEKACPDCLKAANGHPNAMVASLVGADTLTTLRLDPRKLVEGGADHLLTLLPNWGYSVAHSKSLAEMIEVYAARTLFDGRQPPLPSAFASHLELAKEV